MAEQLIADSLTIEPRGIRTSWQTADGRFIFLRHKQGWTVRNGRTQTQQQDQQLLVDASILNDNFNTLAWFDTLAQTRHVLATIVTAADIAVDMRLRQRVAPYITTPVNATILHTPQGWRITFATHGHRGLYTVLYERYGCYENCKELFTDFFALHGAYFPIRQEAFNTLRDRMRTVERSYAALADERAALLAV